MYLSMQYTFVWKLDPAWANSCRRFVLQLKNGTAYHANFIFKK